MYGRLAVRKYNAAELDNRDTERSAEIKNTMPFVGRADDVLYSTVSCYC